MNKGQLPFAARLTLISAPAGFGKTTLVSAWLAQPGAVQSAWLSLDENDNDPARFLAYLIAALQTAEPAIGETAVRLLQAPQPPPAETVLTLLINDISQYGRPLILVLDDYHAITTPAIHQILANLIDYQPPSLHLLLTSRSDPPLPLSRLRARGQMVEIRAGELRFTFDEAGQFLDQVMGIKLSNEALASLEQRTEGWVAGLQLAALSMQGRDDLEAFIAAFTGSYRFILDYLTEEVLEQQTAEMRRFLLQTAILDRFSGPLCDVVTGQSGSQAMLERLEQANLFLTPLDQERHWYRYHTLFADVLRNRIQHSAIDTAELHRRAALWFEQEGLFNEAIRHALAAPDIEQAAALVERNSLVMIHWSELLTLRRWLAQLPAELVQNRPRLILAQGWVFMFSGQSQAAQAWLTSPQVEMVLEGAGATAEIQGELALLRASIVSALFEGDQGLGDAERALALLPEAQRGLRAGAIHVIGIARFRQGDTAAAAQAFSEAVAVGETEDGPYMALDALQDLASIQIRQGYLGQIKQTCQQAMRLASRWAGRVLPGAGMAYIDFGGVLYEQNDLAGAIEALSHGIELLRGSAEHYLLVEGYLLMARANQAFGNLAGAVQALAQAEKWLDQIQVADERTQAFLAIGQARLGLAQGNVKAAVRWAESCTWWPEATHLGYHQAVTLFRVRLAQSRQNGEEDLLAETADKIHQLLSAAEGKGWWGYVIELSFLAALVCQARSRSDEAMDSLERALRTAESEGFVRLFVDEGEEAAALLRQARHQGLFSDYVEKLLGAFRAGEQKQRGADLLPEPLSERELEVLQLMGGGLSNKEIAARLFIAVTTVKKHVGNILVKLDASNRVQAISHARELGLLP